MSAPATVAAPAGSRRRVLDTAAPAKATATKKRAATAPGATTTTAAGKKKAGGAAPSAANASTSASRAMGRLTVNPGDLAADTMSVTNRVQANSRCIALGDDGTVWTGEADGSIAIRLPPLGDEVERIPGEKNRLGRTSTVTVLHRVDGNMWAAYSNGTIKIFATEPNSSGQISIVQEHRQMTSVVNAICEVGRHVCSAGGDWKVYLWDRDDLRYGRLFYGHANSVRALAGYVDPDTEEDVIISGSDDGTVKFWNPRAPAQSERDVACIATIEMPARSGVWSMAVLEDTMELWVGCDDGALRVYDLYSKTCTAVIEGHTAPVVALRQIDDNMWSGSKTGTLLIASRFTKDVVNVVRQPVASRAAAGGVGPCSICIQPVQRTIVNNVWVTGTDGAWQCWSQLSPESVVGGTAPRTYAGVNVCAESEEVSMMMAPGPSAAAKVTSAKDVPMIVAPPADKDETLRDTVASLRRRTVHTLEQSGRRSRPSSPGANSLNTSQGNVTAALVATRNTEIDDAAAAADEATRLDRIEASIRRDRDVALQASEN